MQWHKLWNSTKLRWTLYGAAFGVFFPVFAFGIRYFEYGLEQALYLSNTDPLFWIIFTAPLFLGFFAYLGGVQNQKALDLQKKLESSLRDQIEEQKFQLEASAKLSLLGEVASGIAHEINNPLSYLLGKSQLMKIKAEEERLEKSDLLSGLEKIESMAMRIGKITKGLKSFSRDSTFDPTEPTSVSEIIEIVIELTAEKIKKQNISLETELNPNLVLDCRETEISQILLNLVQNAFDAISDQEKPWVKISVTEENQDILFSVMDSGKGISEEIKNQIMEPFFTTKKAKHGTGLGLSVSRKLAQNHRGTLVHDSKQKHTTFVLRLPKKQLSSA